MTDFQKKYAPPGDWLQNLNALLHQEPLTSLAYGLYWSLFFVTVSPVAIMFLQVQAAYRIIVWAVGVLLGQKDAYDPSKQIMSASKAKTTPPVELAVVITGCDSGFGKELALWADRAKFHVFAGCLHKESFVQFDKNMTTTNITPLLMDVTKDDHVDAAVAAVEKWLDAADGSSGKRRVLHALCNNAGIMNPLWVDWMEMKDIRLLMEVNYFGMVRCCKAFLPIMKRQVREGTHPGSRILNVASAAGKATIGGALTAYAASKHAAVAFSSGLRIDMSVFGIQVCTICPTFHGTPMVADSLPNVSEAWKKLPRQIIEEYGEEFREFNEKEILNAQSYMWRMDVVVEQLMKALTCKSVPKELYVGADAKFVATVNRMMPHSVLDLFLRNFPRPRPVPACLRK